MSHPWQCRVPFIYLIVILTHVRTLYTYDTTNDDNAENLPPDFVNFVKDLGLMDREEKKNITEVQTMKTTTKNITRKLRNRRRHNEIKATQNAALRDMLMLKLVSYYEDKYNLAQKDFTTPPMLMPLKKIPPENSKMSNDTDSIEHSMFVDTWMPSALRSNEKVQKNINVEQITQEPTNTYDEVVAL